MSYIQLEPYKVPGPGRYEEFRYNESPKWSLHQRVSSESICLSTQSSPKQL